MTLICAECGMVEDVDYWERARCFDGEPHQMVTALAVECPHLTRTATGRTSPRRVKIADQECISPYHHFGDPERHHFVRLGGAR